MTDIMQKVFQEIHAGMVRQGPGNAASTRRAFSMLPPLPVGPYVLDVGCGPGAQTLELATLIKGMITALDVDQGFLDMLRDGAHQQKNAADIVTVQASMFDMPFARDSFDLIWSEGAIYIMGFERGLTTWRPFLKEKGIVAVSHISWLTSEVPKEPKAFWQAAYPEITSITENLATIARCGYRNIAHFTLPEAAWWDDYYVPLEKRLHLLREKYRDDNDALAIVEEELREIALYRTYSDHYGYVFYLMQRVV
jgi:ubiquinone/menaquinone biosynthesis C-methylase UbiE